MTSNACQPTLPEDVMGYIIMFICDSQGLAAASLLCRHFRHRARERYLEIPHRFLPLEHEWDFRLTDDETSSEFSDVKDTHGDVKAELRGTARKSKDGLEMTDVDADAEVWGWSELSPFEWGGEMSIEVCVKYNQLLEGSPVFDFAKQGSYTDYTMIMEIDEVYLCNDGITAGILFGIGRGDARDGPKYIIAGEFDLNAWTHVIVTAKGRFMRIYKNGELAGELDKGWEPQVITRGMHYIGKSVDSPLDSPLDGSLKYLRIYEKALSSTEIRALYNANNNK
ncbi:hypothetical protein TrVE_jg12427 [Triparma verrucosa]|uniref:Uncharacterized protein n=1 Tax=Triparma verrucosa TaxID=1606542 RepID=A0A9W7F6K3_9STRA|nr:hypothetical protein TrVE_jg12427 [Triparma verrucosa]